MAEWTPEAREYLDGYLGQVSALARHQGDDADEIVTELREHIQREAEGAGGPLVTVDQLRAVLAAIGTPDQVAGVESALEGPEDGGESLRDNVQRLRDEGEEARAPGPPPQRHGVEQKPKRSDLGYWVGVAGSVVFLAGLWYIIVLASILWNEGEQRERYRQYQEKVTQTMEAERANARQNQPKAEGADGQTAQTLKAWEQVLESQMGKPALSPAETTALEIVGCIAALQYVAKGGQSGDGDYGTLNDLRDQAKEAGLDEYVDLLLARAKEHGYQVTIEVTPEGPDQQPGYTCICEPVESGPTTRRRYYVDQRMTIRYTDDGSTPSLLSAEAPGNDDVLTQGFLSLHAEGGWGAARGSAGDRRSDPNATPSTLLKGWKEQLPRDRLEANEQATVRALQTIASAQAQFRDACRRDLDGDGKGEYGTLAQLANPDGEGKATPLIDPRLASGTKNGYRFRMRSTATTGKLPTFSCTAVPERFGVTGQMKYYVDQSGIIRCTGDGSMPAKDSLPLD